MKKSKWRAKKPLYIKKSDDRYKRHKKQLEQYGFSDTETWGLYSVIAEFTLPRLKRFRDIKGGFPTNLKNQDEWNKVLDKMIFALEYALDDDWEEDEEKAKELYEKYEEGMKLFAENFLGLWW